MPSDNQPWNVPVSVDDIAETGGHYELAADEPARAALARAAGLRGVAKLEATFDVTRRGSDIAVKGEVKARVGQTCVVTLEPIENEVREPIDLVFATSSDTTPAAKPGEDAPEPLEDGVLDLGALATEFVMLGIDPYPRKPGVEFASPGAEKAGESPFAALAKLKNRP